jgi:hypothetical protein
MDNLVTPTCRYDHGPLARAAFSDVVKWSLVAMDHSGFTFTGNLYVCSKCGYTEFFDDDFVQTVKDIEEHERTQTSRR